MRRDLVSVLLAVFMFVLSASVAAAGSVLVNGRTTDIYIVSFKPPADGEQPFIWPAIRIEDRPPGTPPVPFGEHSSGQSKADVAAALGLVGELTHILDGMNAIIVRVDESEAERLSQLPIVAYVQRSGTTILGSAQPTPEGEHATYQYGVLTLPRVDTPEQVGQYQDAQFRQLADGTWQLTGLRALQGNGGLAKVPIETVEVVRTEALPAAVYLLTAGWVSPCGYEGKLKVRQRRQDKHFEVAIIAPVLVADEPYACTANVDYVRLTIPLEVYGLAAGAYTYDVNGVTGGFSLAADNRYPEDCDSSQVAYCP
jgi:hypothetical protein